MKNKIYLKIGTPVSISEISIKTAIADKEKIISILTFKIKDHFSLFGVEPFSIEYSRQADDYIIRARSTIGRVDCGLFIIEISPKFRNLELGKCLQLAHYSQSLSLVCHDNNLCEDMVSDHDFLKGVDYFALAFNSSVQDCINNGLIKTFSIDEKVERDLKGRLSISSHVRSGGNPLTPFFQSSIRSINCTENSIIKAALSMCVNTCVNQEIIRLSSSLLESFQDCDDLVDFSIIDFSMSSSTIPRPDYEKALSFAGIIINGFDPVLGDKESFSPYFTIDLDLLFERYCAFEVKNILSERHFTVMIQDRLDHQFEPSIAGKKISPDIVIKSILNEKNVIIDTKNKFSLLESNANSFSNSDIFQIFYYAISYGSKIGILLYPGDIDNFSRYPLKGSDSKKIYEQKRLRVIKDKIESGNDVFKLNISGHNVFYLLVWRINLSGSLYDTKKSVAEFCNFVSDFCENEEIFELAT